MTVNLGCVLCSGGWLSILKGCHVSAVSIRLIGCPGSTKTQKHMKAIFQTGYNFPLQMAWPCSRTLGICVVILLSRLAINSALCLFPPQTVCYQSLPGHTLARWPRAAADPFLARAPPTAGCLPRHLGKRAGAVFVKCRLRCLKIPKKAYQMLCSLLTYGRCKVKSSVLSTGGHVLAVPLKLH